MTTKEIIALIVEKIDIIGSFRSVVDASRWEQATITGQTNRPTPMAIVGFAGSQNDDSEYGCLSKDTYTIQVVCNMANDSEDIYELIELVRSTIHGQSWSEDVWPFLWDSTNRISADPGTIVYELNFTTKHNIDRGDL